MIVLILAPLYDIMSLTYIVDIPWRTSEESNQLSMLTRNFRISPSKSVSANDMKNGAFFLSKE